MQAQISSADLRAAIAAANQRFVGAFRQHDVAAMAQCYTENAQLLPAHSDFVKGRVAIQQFWQGILEMALQGAELETIEVEGFGDTAIEVGNYTLSGDAGIADRGKYIVVWKREEDRWRMHRDIWNTSMPV
jgi:uncharacterized protein (TIGR02246 family)